MALSAAEIDSLFFESVPDEIQRALTQCVFGAYRTVFADCSKFQEEEAKDIRPFFRWVQIRSDLRGLPARFEGVSATPERYHTRVTCGKIIITASAVQDPSDMPRRATYRAEYANNQLDLFAEHAVSDGEYLYAILAHGPDPTDHRQPQFIHIGFPDRRYQGYLHRIDLFERHAALVESLQIPSGESQDTLPRVEPKKHVQRREG